MGSDDPAKLVEISGGRFVARIDFEAQARIASQNRREALISMGDASVSLFVNSSTPAQDLNAAIGEVSSYMETFNESIELTLPGIEVPYQEEFITVPRTHEW